MCFPAGSGRWLRTRPRYSPRTPSFFRMVASEPPMPLYTLSAAPSSPWTWRRVFTTSIGWVQVMATIAAPPPQRNASMGQGSPISARTQRAGRFSIDLSWPGWARSIEASSSGGGGLSICCRAAGLQGERRKEHSSGGTGPQALWRVSGGVPWWRWPPAWQVAAARQGDCVLLPRDSGWTTSTKIYCLLGGYS